MIVTYGGHGGARCAGQLRQALEALNMKPVPTMPGFILPRPHIEANAGTIDPAQVFGAQVGPLQAGLTELAAAV